MADSSKKSSWSWEKSLTLKNRYAGINLLSGSPLHVLAFIAEVRYQNNMTAVLSYCTVCFSALFKMKFGYNFV